MICLYEQYGYERTGFYAGLTDDQIGRLSSIKESGYIIHVLRKNKQERCVSIDFDRKEEKFHFQTSYFIGVDWIVENQLPVYIQPKQNNEACEIDYMSMLLEALQEPENLKHLDDLVHIDFHKPYIPITQKQDKLSPFLIAQFLQIVHRIVRKGLKKSYYTFTDDLNSRVKGKILVGRNVKENLVKGKQIHSLCQYQDFGLNCDENKLLKKAYQFARRYIQQYSNGFNTQPLLEIINYIHPAFENVSDDIEVSTMKTLKISPLFREYDQAIKLAKLIFKRFSYNITKTGQEIIMTPPFWIDMSKLFELYVYKKLREVFRDKDEVEYHYSDHFKEIDFLINSPKNGVKMVVDTKYKPRYHKHSIDLEDCRQVSAYARLKSIYEKFKIDHGQTIDCLIIYPNQTDSPYDINFDLKESLSSYVCFYKLGIRLREIS